MRGLQQSLRPIEESGQRSEDKSAESRAVVHKPMDELVSGVGHLETGMPEMKPVTDDVTRGKLMGIGALGVIGIGGMVLGVTFVDANRRIGQVIIGKT